MNTFQKQQGFVLIVSLVFLLVMTVLVTGTMVGTTQNERMSGSYLDRNRAYQAAEQALRAGERALASQGEACLSNGCANDTSNGFGALLNALPNNWVATGSLAVTKSGNQMAYSYLVNPLASSLLPAAKSTAGCSAYSIRGRGQGLASNTAVVLQTVIYLCPA
jgi:type IV pilus assembly protein PilX